MGLVSWLVSVGGILLIALAVFRVRAPYAQMRQLERLAQNAHRYDSWRGGRRTAADAGGESGADVMRAVMRRRVLTWAATAAAGTVLVLLGFVVR